MNQEFHAIIVDKSQKDLGIFHHLNVIGTKTVGDWLLYKVSVNEQDLEKVTKEIQNNMKKSTWYFHFYNEDGSKLVVVFPKKTFYTDKHQENWEEAIKYGKSINIPVKQLSFRPNTFKAEEY